MKKRYVLGLLAIMVAFATLGFQCQKVTDPASNTAYEYPSPEYAPPFSTSDFDNEESCQYACNEYYSALLEAENEYHDEVMSGLDGGPELKDEKKAEIERHKQAVRMIQDARQQCVRDCHDQGGIDGGF
jgi:hypothetical protein